MKNIVVIILHYGEVAVTKACVESLLKKEKYPFQLITVNNTQEKLTSKMFANKKITVINNSENKGFAGGVNVGIKKAMKKRCDAVLLLNNDTKVEKPFIEDLVKTLFSVKEIGIVGPAIEFIKERRKFFDVGGFVNWFGKTKHEEVKSIKNAKPHEVLYMTGAAMLIKKEVFQKSGLFDEQFFLYYEDVDFCLRAKQKGFLTYVNPTVSVYHVLSKTAGKMSSLAVYHQTKSALVFGKKYINNPFVLLANRLFIVLQIALFIKLNFFAGVSGVRAMKDYIFQQKQFVNLVLVTSIICLTIAGFWRVLTFDFWIDDWYLIWTSLYNFSGGHWYFNHPGLPLEFYVLSHVFGLQVLWWEIVNLLLKIIVAYLVGIFMFELTRSKKIQFLSSLFFAASYLGFEAIDSPIMNVAALVSIPMLLSIIYFIKSLQGKISFLLYSLIFLGVAIILDPARMIPLFILFPLLLFHFPKNSNVKLVIKYLKRVFIVGLVIGLPLFALWFWHFESNSQIGHVLYSIFSDNFSVLRKINRVGNLFATIGNMWSGLLYPLPQDPQNAGVYIRWVGWIGIAFFLSGLISFVQFIKTKKKVVRAIAFFILWIFLFYLPNWFSEPRAPMAGPHRYLFISSIGFCCLVAYLVLQLKNKWLVVLISGIFIGLNLFQANRILTWQATYRSKTVVENVWNTVVRDVHFNNTQLIFVFYGEEPWLHQIVDLSAASPFVLKKHLGKSVPAPLFTRDPKVITAYLCSNTNKQQISLSDIYAWNITKNGGIENISQTVRSSMVLYAKQQGCFPQE